MVNEGASQLNEHLVVLSIDVLRAVDGVSTYTVERIVLVLYIVADFSVVQG